MPTNLSRKDKKRRDSISEKEITRIIFKALFYNRKLPWHVRENARTKLAKMGGESSVTRAKNRCVVTGRGKGILRRVRSSRIVIREKAVKGALVGKRKEGNN
jgi:small subunit ribosomal protein S14